MGNIVFNLMIIGWAIGVIFALSLLIYTFIKRDKEGFKIGIYMMLLFGLTGYLTFFPVTIALLIFNRFSNGG